MSKDSTTVTEPGTYTGLSDEERALVNTEIELADFNLQQLKKQSAFQDQLRAVHPSSIEGVDKFLENEAAKSARNLFLQDQRADLEEEGIALAGELIPLQTEIARKQFEEFELGGKASEKTLQIIQELSEGQRTAGQAGLDQSLEAVLAQLQGAGGEGEFAKTTAEAGRQSVQFDRGVDAFSTRSKINFPLQNAGLTDTRSGNLSGLGALSGQFQSELQAQATANRTQLTGSVGNLGLGLATGVQGNPGALAIGQNANRVAGAGSTTTTTGGNAQGIISGVGAGVGAISALSSVGAFGAIGAGASAAGAAIGTGAAAAAAAAGTGASAIGSSLLGLLAFFSHSSLKDNITPAEGRDTLERLKTLDVNRWRYKGENVTHIGPMAEDFKRVFGVGDGYSLNIIDLAGVLLSAIKGLDEELKNGTRFRNSNGNARADS